MASFLFLLATVILAGLALLAGGAWLPDAIGRAGDGARWGLGLVALGGFLLLALGRRRGAVNRMALPAVLPAVLIVAAAAWLVSMTARHAVQPPPPTLTEAAQSRPAIAAPIAPPPERSSKTLVDPLAGTLRIPADRSGHFLIQGRVNGEPVTFLVDTGATRVALSEADARRAGLHPLATDFTHRVNTAHGSAMTAEATLRSVEVGPIEVREVPALIVASDLGVSLLGMSFLSRLSSYSVEDGVLDLRR
jgi:aspartyl protease family protein